MTSPYVHNIGDRSRVETRVASNRIADRVLELAAPIAAKLVTDLGNLSIPEHRAAIVNRALDVAELLYMTCYRRQEADFFGEGPPRPNTSGDDAR